MASILFMARLTGSDYRANAARAETLLKDHGFSVGHMQAHEPRGILYGEYDIQKWRNLNRQHREELDGLMSGRHPHHGQVSLEILDTAPLDAVRKLAETLESEDGVVIIVRPPAAMCEA